MPHFLHFWSFFLVVSLFKMHHKHTAEAKKAVMLLMENTPVLGKLYRGMHFRAVGCEASVNKSTLYFK